MINAIQRKIKVERDKISFDIELLVCVRTKQMCKCIHKQSIINKLKSSFFYIIPSLVFVFCCHKVSLYSPS